jgi:hypothetical protein
VSITRTATISGTKGVTQTAVLIVTP